MCHFKMVNKHNMYNSRFASKYIRDIPNSVLIVSCPSRWYTK